MLLSEHQPYHVMGPKDIGLDPDKKSAMTIDVLRTTNHTGEQLHVQVPVYGNETREEVQQRLGFVYSLIQDRLEEENKAVAWRNERSDIIRRASEMSRRNQERLTKQLRLLDRKRKSERWTEETFIAERTKLMKEFEAVDAVNQAKIAHASEELQAAKELPYTGPTEDSAFREETDKMPEEKTEEASQQ